MVYVDNDPIVADARPGPAHRDRTTTVVAGRHAPTGGAPGPTPTCGSCIDFDQPVGLLLLRSCTTCTTTTTPAVARRLIDALPSGSYVAISHFYDPGAAQPGCRAGAGGGEGLQRALGTGRWRTREEILSFFGGLELLPPGLVPLAEWHPDGEEDTRKSFTYHTIVGGVARKA